MGWLKVRWGDDEPDRAMMLAAGGKWTLWLSGE